jgi:hypothetical protein
MPLQVHGTITKSPAVKCRVANCRRNTKCTQRFDYIFFSLSIKKNIIGKKMQEFFKFVFDLTYVHGAIIFTCKMYAYVQYVGLLAHIV